MKVIGDCTLYHGDCMEILQSLGKFDSLVTDPPYKMEIHGRGFAAKREYYSKLDYGTTTEFELSQDYYSLILERIKEINMIFFCNKLMKLDIENWAVNSGYTFDELVLLKSAPSPLTNNQWLPDKEFAVHVFRNCSVKGDYRTKKTWFQNSNYKQTETEHPSAKPVYILEHIIKNISNLGDIVLDTFMGSGTTGIACIKNGRKFIGIEKDKAYYDMSCERIERFYNQPDMFANAVDTK